MKTIGHRRLAGAALGALAGAISGRLGGQAVNDLVIQPVMNPEAVAREQQWLAQHPNGTRCPHCRLLLRDYRSAARDVRPRKFRDAGIRLSGLLKRPL